MNILIVEDNSDHSELIRIALSGVYRIRIVERLSDVEHALATDHFDAIICDLSLPDGDGMANIVAIRRLTKAIPLVVLTCLDDTVIAMEALNNGAQDYLVKSEALNPLSARHTLDRSIRYSIQRQQLAQEKEQLLVELQNSQQELTQKNENLSRQYEMAHRFVDNVSHEFRTPLTVIKSYSSIIRDGLVGDVNEEQQKMLGIIEDRADDLNTMVDDMLDVSKLEAGLIGICRRECTMEEILDNIAPSLERKAAVRNVELSKNTTDHLPAVWCDPEKIGRIIINLAVNAIKFCGEPGKVSIEAELDSIHQEVIVAVQDNGEGIADEELESIFQRFQQSISTVKHQVKGFGLGLAIANELVELNYGKISVTSQVGKGSKFSFSIPVSHPEEILRRQFDRCQIFNRPDSPTQLVVIEIKAAQALPRDYSDLQLFLEQHVTADDQIFRPETDRWLIVKAVRDREFRFDEVIQESHRKFSRNRPAGPLPGLTLEFSEWISTAEGDSNQLLEIYRESVSKTEECLA